MPLQFYYKNNDAEEIELTESERTERTKKLVMERKKKMRESGPASSTSDGGGEAAVRIRGAGLQTPHRPGGIPQEQTETAPAGQVVEDAGSELDRTVSAELYDGLLSNPKLTAEQRQKLIEMQAKRMGKTATSDDVGTLQEWLSRTASRQDLARNRRELEILKTLGSELTDAQLVRAPSASSQVSAAEEVRRLEEAGTRAEISRVAGEVAQLKAELGLSASDTVE